MTNENINSNFDYNEFIKEQNKRFYEEELFTYNHDRWEDLKEAYAIAKKLFPFAQVYVTGNPANYTSSLLYVIGTNICVREEEEIKQFKKMISKATVVDITPAGIDKVILELCFKETQPQCL